MSNCTLDTGCKVTALRDLIYAEQEAARWYDRALVTKGYDPDALAAMRTRVDNYLSLIDVMVTSIGGITPAEFVANVPRDDVYVFGGSMDLINDLLDGWEDDGGLTPADDTVSS